MMFVHTDTKSPTSPLRALSVLVFLLLLIHLCTGQSLIGSSQPIVATRGDDITLPCRLDPAEDVTDLTVEWTRPDLDPRFVHVWRSGEELVDEKHPWFRERTSLFINELKHGNISLKLSRVELSDQGTYTCFIPGKEKLSSVQLFVASDAVSSPILTLEGVDKTTGGVVLECESEGWYPEPEVLWLDGEGNLLSAGPTETVRGPDDLYTVSSRVTVEKRHSNSFTCRVRQNNINQTRETEIRIPDDFFKVQSSSSSVIIGLAVSLAVCVMFILSLVFYLWKREQNSKTKRNQDETDNGEKKNRSKGNKSKDQFVTKGEREIVPLMTETQQMENLNKGKEEVEKNHVSKETRHYFISEQGKTKKRQREEAEKKVKTLKEELETKKNEVEKKQTELQQLSEEKQRRETELQTLKEELRDKNTELEEVKAELAGRSWLVWYPSKAEQQRKKKEAEDAIEKLKEQLETKDKELQTKTKECEEKQVELQQLREEDQKMETDLQNLDEELENIKSSQDDDRGVEIRQLQTENQRLREELANKNKQYQEERKIWERTKKELWMGMQTKNNQYQEERNLWEKTEQELRAALQTMKTQGHSSAAP